MSSYLNLGCGLRFHPAWTNVDFVAGDPSVVAHDLRRGVPFGDEQFEVVYHSHVLEHFSKADAEPFLKECRRVLKPGGVVRVAVPDLERAARVYLQALEKAEGGDDAWRDNYDWMMLELYDQTVRERSGGEMAAYLLQEEIPNKEFVIGRVGVEAERIIESAAQSRESVPAGASPPQRRSPGAVLRRLYGMVRRPSFRRESSTSRRESAIRKLLGEEYELLRLGRFRRGGEVHLWMYDRHSLARALRAAGFRDPRVVGAAESRIQGWAGFQLDTEPDGTTYKPDSLFMEAVK
ncbi:MAG TPA: methyltransferase domain-containing protein [Pyrinomonadaceae bacterium]|nr:methyltransferase domain-containing protein [Pyrinomonadaceae bacterium]